MSGGPPNPTGCRLKIQDSAVLTFTSSTQPMDCNAASGCLVKVISNEDSHTIDNDAALSCTDSCPHQPTTCEMLHRMLNHNGGCVATCPAEIIEPLREQLCSSEQPFLQCGTGTYWCDTEQQCRPHYGTIVGICKAKRGRFAWTCEDSCGSSPSSSPDGIIIDGGSPYPFGSCGTNYWGQDKDGATKCSGDDTGRLPYPAGAAELHAIGNDHLTCCQNPVENNKPLCNDDTWHSKQGNNNFITCQSLRDLMVKNNMHETTSCALDGDVMDVNGMKARDVCCHCKEPDAGTAMNGGGSPYPFGSCGSNSWGNDKDGAAKCSGDDDGRLAYAAGAAGLHAMGDDIMTCCHLPITCLVYEFSDDDWHSKQGNNVITCQSLRDLMFKKNMPETTSCALDGEIVDANGIKARDACCHCKIKKCPTGFWKDVWGNVANECVARSTCSGKISTTGEDRAVIAGTDTTDDTCTPCAPGFWATGNENCMPNTEDFSSVCESPTDWRPNNRFSMMNPGKPEDQNSCQAYMEYFKSEGFDFAKAPCYEMVAKEVMGLQMNIVLAYAAEKGSCCQADLTKSTPEGTKIVSQSTPARCQTKYTNEMCSVGQLWNGTKTPPSALIDHDSKMFDVMSCDLLMSYTKSQYGAPAGQIDLNTMTCIGANAALTMEEGDTTITLVQAVAANIAYYQCCEDPNPAHHDALAKGRCYDADPSIHSQVTQMLSEGGTVAEKAALCNTCTADKTSDCFKCSQYRDAVFRTECVTAKFAKCPAYVNMILG
jgi:hypothetical protein